MRNLRNARLAALDFGEDSALLSGAAWDADGLICGFGPDGDNSTITLKRFASDATAADDGVTLASWDAPSPDPKLLRDRILDVHSFPDTGTISIILEGGDIIVVRTDAQDDGELIEIVGSVDAGIVAAAWSPDEELLVVATKAQTLLFMTREFEGITNVTLSAEDLKVSDHVSVGWGKSETQFRGRGAKALRDPTVPERVDRGDLSNMDDSRCYISWRGDGQYVAVSSVLEASPRRRIIRVYSREGQLDSVSEPVDGLEGAISWKPSGQIIAGVKRLEDSIDIVFFERNGLRHGGFSLRLSKDEIAAVADNLTLHWNVDSTVLAISMKDRVQLWTMGNYHYYLKQEIHLAGVLNSTIGACWHPESPLSIACLSATQVNILKYTFDVSRASNSPPHDQGLVTVIDGKVLKVTPLRVGNVPPPMALDEITLQSNMIDVATNQDGTRIAVLEPDRVTVWDCQYSSKASPSAKLDEVCAITTQSHPTRPIYRQVAFDEQDRPVVLSSVANAAGSILIWPTLPSEHYVEVPHTVTSIFRCANRNLLCCLDDTGSISEITGACLGANIGKLPGSSIVAEVWQQDERIITFGLSSNGSLQIQNGKQSLKVSGCTSFIITHSHLVFTTSQHLLKFVHLHAGDVDVPPDEPEKDERCRNIERGAKLVTVIPSAYSLVLQMPRGNLETIYPRALVLAGIRQAIVEHDYKRAFRICRTQRVDMNILHDYAPQQFMSDIELFVKQVKKVEYIDLFLSSLTEENVASTIYRETLKTSSDQINGSDEQSDAMAAEPKVNRICDAFLTVLANQSELYLQTIITAHVSKNPPDLEAGIALVSQLRKKGEAERLEQAVEHICFLADVNRLYETALGMYDLDVTLLIAEQSQKDPREYLPYLQKLHEMELLRRRFAIDNDLKRFSKALTHLHAIGDFEELKFYTSRHELYNEAIDLYRYEKSRLDELMRLFAEYLSSRNRFKESGIAYEYISDYHSAYEAYRAASMWSECLACASMDGMPDVKLSELAQDLANSLEEAKEFIAAATVYLDHLHDLEPGVRLLCRGYRFSDAIRHVAQQRRPELLASTIDPGLVEASATITELLADMKTQLAAQIPRLRELRRKKADDPMAFLDGGGGGDDGGAGNNADIPDYISLAPTDASTSGGTFMTRYTNRSTGTLATNASRKTSRNRRREERKRAKGKKGTVYEEEYLVNSVARLVQRLNESGEDVARLTEGLMRRGMRERAVAVDAALQTVVAACKECMAEVFGTPTAAPPADDGAEGELMPRPMGGQGVLWDAMAASQQQREAPVLKSFERLTLLG